jgi:RNA polymerase sigma-70 factor (ECF subfamily)
MCKEKIAEMSGPDSLLSDEEVIQLVQSGETELFEIIIRRYNQRVYRTIRSIVGNDGEAEQVMQDVYVSAYTHLREFDGVNRFSIWLTRIAIHEGLARARQTRNFVELDPLDEVRRESAAILASRERSADQHTIDRELRFVVEPAIDALPDLCRSVFVLRELEGLGPYDTADCLELTEETVKTQFHRARASVRNELYARTVLSLSAAYEFTPSRGDRVVAAFFGRIRQ